MKYLILFFSVSSFACENFLPKSQLELIASGVDLKDNVKFCKDLPEEECICYEGKDLRFIKIEKEKVEVPIYAKKHESTCKDNVSCWDLLNEYVKGEKCSKENGSDKENESGWEPIYNPNEMSVYCAKQTGVKLEETGKSILSEDEVKKQKILQAEIEKETQAAIKETKKIEAKGKLKSIQVESIKSTKDIKEVLKEIVEILKD